MKKPLSAPRLPREVLAPLTRCLGSVEGVFVVGGCLRDLVMGRRPADWDIAVTGDPEPVARALAALAGGRAVRIGKGDRFVYRVVVGLETVSTSLRPRRETWPRIWPGGISPSTPWPWAWHPAPL